MEGARHLGEVLLELKQRVQYFKKPMVLKASEVQQQHGVVVRACALDTELLRSSAFGPFAENCLADFQLS